MARSAAVRRLERILNDEDYGPKLARMNRRDEAHILDLIDRNKGREARKEILRLDKERLERRRGRSQPAPKPTLTIETLRAQAYANLRQQLRGKPSTQQRGVELMTVDELKFAKAATREPLRKKASEPPTPYPDLDIEFNPFWYK